MLYGAQIWDPILIVSQIVALQCIFYLGIGILLAALVGLVWVLLHESLLDSNPSKLMLAAPYAAGVALDHIFDWRWMNLQSFESWMIMLAFLLNSILMAFALRLIVKRAKKCLDFASTTYIIHLVIVSIYGNFPVQFTWWIAVGSSLAITAAFGEWLCLQEELKEIPLASIPRQRGSNRSVELGSLSIEK